MDGTIDAICTDHHPQEIERKNVEFEYAANGAISLQIALSLAIEGRNRFYPRMDDNTLLTKFNYGGADILKLDIQGIQIGSEVSFTVINPNRQTSLNRKNNLSESANTYYMNKPLPYFIEATFLSNNSLFNTHHH
jgi:dihydroorotase